MLRLEYEGFRGLLWLSVSGLGRRRARGACAWLKVGFVWQKHIFQLPSPVPTFGFVWKFAQGSGSPLRRCAIPLDVEAGEGTQVIAGISGFSVWPDSMPGSG